MKEFKLCAFADEAGDALSEQIKALKENEISNLEIRNVDNINVSDLTVTKAKEIKHILDENDLRVFSIGSPIGKIGIDDDFCAHLEKFKRTLEIPNILDAKCFRLFSFYIENGYAGSPKDYKKNPDDYKTQVIEQLGEFVKTNEDSGIMLCHENEKGIFGDVALRCLEIHKALPELRAVYDPANFIQCGEDTIKAFEMLKSYIHYMHIKDATADGTIVPSGKGVGKIAELVKMYQGEILTLEPHLYEFSGLKNLEKQGEESTILQSYKDNREAFDAGVNALKDILKGV